jgi:hypothetical protein
MKRVKLAILAFGITVSLSFCIVTGFRDGVGANTVEIENPTISTMTAVT